MVKKGYIDLHVHSYESDGIFSPKYLVGEANKNNVSILSITDHDTIRGLDAFRGSIPSDMIGIKGVEFSSYVVDNGDIFKIHMLGYCFDETNPAFKSLICEMADKRVNAHLGLLNVLKEKIKGFPKEKIQELGIDKYCWFDREIINYLVMQNYPTEMLESLRTYCKDNRFSYGRDYDLNARKVIDAIHSAGGYAVFAHPMAYNFSNNIDRLKNVIDKLIEFNVDGIEIYQSDCPRKDTIWLKNIADNNHLLYSVGSDFHRDVNSDGRQIGLGIDNSLCITETTLTNEIIESKKYIKR